MSETPAPKPLRWYDAITINIYYFALTLRSQSLTPLIVPLLVQRFVGDATKGTSYGNLRLVSLMVALLVQAVAGMLSDHNSSRWGRRRPFILLSTILEILAFLGVGWIAGSMEGMAGYWSLFAVIVCSMVFSNIGHGAAQGLIPDLVPPSQRGRYSGIKAFFELPLPLIFVAFTISRMVSAGNLWAAILTIIAVFIVTTALTMMVREQPVKSTKPMDWTSLLRLAAMTAVFTVIILLIGAAVRLLLPHLLALKGSLALVLVGAAGVAGMLLAVALGVIASVRISLGSESAARPSFTWWVINRLAFLVGANNLAGFVLYFIQERFPELQGNLAAQPASLLMMVVGIAILVISIPSGWLTDKFGAKRLLFVSGLLATLGTVIVIMAGSLTVMFVGGVLVGLATGAFFSSNWALGTSIVPKDEAGRWLGISNLAGAGAGAVGAYIGGPIGDGAGYVLLMGLYGFLFLFSILALIRIKPEASA